MENISFSGTVKEELCKIENIKDCCKKAECYGFLLFSRSFRYNDISFKTEYEFCIQRFNKLVREECNIIPEITAPIKKNGLFSGSVINEEDRLNILNMFFHQKNELALRINRGNFENDCCVSAFLRGAFIASGSISNPEREYHLELLISHKRLANDLITLISENLSMPKITERKSSYVIYYKESESIEDFLTYIGATSASMELMQIKMMKNLRNNINRTTNCMTANISKTLAAVRKQNYAIKIIENAGGLEILPPELYEVAVLRKENDDASLSELGSMLNEPLSRSGVNHRLNKIIEIASKIENMKEF